MSQALYKKLVDDILQKISTGKIVVGQRLLPEAEYAEQLGVSRSTLRLAFSKLENSGIIKRTKRGGTQVISDTPVKRYRLNATDANDVIGVTRDTMLVLLDICSVSAGSVAELSKYESDGDSWLACSADRYFAGQTCPLAAVKIYIPQKYSHIGLQIGDTAGSILDKVEERYDVTAGRIRQHFSSALCSEEVANKLGLNIGDPVLTILVEIEQSTGELIEVANAIVDPARFNACTDVFVGN